jgi:hypothetical protein
MYATWMVIFKMVSDALSAGFGMLGLLFDFKDKHQKITRMGRVALIGIATSFLVSIAISALEAKKSHDETVAATNAESDLKHRYEELQLRYEKGVIELEAATERDSNKVAKKVLRPLGDISVSLQFSALRRYNPEADDYRRYLLHVPAVWNLYFSKLPVECGSLYPHESVVSTVTNKVGSPDLNLQLDTVPNLDVVKDPPLWKFFRFRGDSMVERYGELHLITTDGEISSVDDIPGSTLLIETLDPTYQRSGFDFGLSGLSISFAKGVGIGLPKEAFPLKEFDKPTEPSKPEWQERVFCYTFPADTKL